MQLLYITNFLMKIIKYIKLSIIFSTQNKFAILSDEN